VTNVEGVVVVIELDTVEPAIPVVTRDFTSVVFEHVDDPPVLAVLLGGLMSQTRRTGCRGIDEHHLFN
jgi:hypothetical protein